MKLKIFRFYLILLSVMSVGFSYAQSSELLDNKIQQLPEKKLKIYMNEFLRVSEKQCAKYYVIAQFEDKKFQFKDTIQCFYTSNDNLYVTGQFNNGKFDGKFKSFYENGQPKRTFEYDNGTRNGLWQKFNKNGELIKKVLYKDKAEFLIDFYDNQRNLIVANGNGKYEDSLTMSSSSDFKVKVWGTVKNGLPDREWIYYLNENLIGKEFFKDFIFKKGISYSKELGQRDYYDYFIATFTDVIPIENLKLDYSYNCKKKDEIENKEVEINLGWGFFERFNKYFFKQKLDKVVEDGWYFIDISTVKNRKIDGVKIISNANKKDINLIKNLIFDLKNPHLGRISRYNSSYKENYHFFIIIIKNGIPYNEYDDGDIDLLKFDFKF